MRIKEMSFPSMVIKVTLQGADAMRLDTLQTFVPTNLRKNIINKNFFLNFSGKNEFLTSSNKQYNFCKVLACISRLKFPIASKSFP